MGNIKKFLNFVVDVIKGMWNDNIYAYSAQAAFFVTISFIPFIMLMLSIVRYLPLTQEQLIAEAIKAFPQAARSLVASLIEEAYSKSGIAIVSITAVSSLWSASIGVHAFACGVNRVYCARETRNYFVVRFMSIVYTLCLILMIVMCLAIFVFGNSIVEAKTNIPAILKAAPIVGSLRSVTGMLILSTVFCFVFVFMPNRKGRFICQIPGALFSGAGWGVFSFVFSYYYENMSGYSYLYGSLSVMVFFMLWLFFCIYILLTGAEIGKCIEDRVNSQ